MQKVIIRLLDIIISLVALILLSPVFVVVCVMIFFDLGHSIFFVQQRLGQDRKLFKMIKFRSMRDVELDASQHHETVNKYAIKLKNDPRITPFGAFIRKTSLDELPQLFNVLSGKMSLVGPRPWVPEEYTQFPEQWFSRLNTKPGITGLAQINGRSDLAMPEVIKLDNEWERRYSVMFYWQILFRTVAKIVQGHNTY
ncbi:MAG: lipopolysaccharide/colanic/teichoic acid biosynthesis glycosyltransferase [Alteromonadaceae bacterium]|jgi:lipopolysaccharide/colanic/teichoic acid biosynthesis glycosyltransferase